MGATLQKKLSIIREIKKNRARLMSDIRIATEKEDGETETGKPCGKERSNHKARAKIGGQNF